MKLKEYIEKAGIVKLMAKDVISKLMELEHICNWLNVMLGIEVEITVKPAKQKEGRFYGKGIIDKLNN